ncbi:hypothetical protein CFE70_000073 [Pyrenophora teres f. teres 0-1]
MCTYLHSVRFGLQHEHGISSLINSGVSKADMQSSVYQYNFSHASDDAQSADNVCDSADGAADIKEDLRRRLQLPLAQAYLSPPTTTPSHNLGTRQLPSVSSAFFARGRLCFQRPVRNCRYLSHVGTLPKPLDAPAASSLECPF